MGNTCPYGNNPRSSDCSISPLRTHRLAKNGRSLTVTHSILLWPTVKDELIQHGFSSLTDFLEIEKQGTSWFINHEIASELHEMRYSVNLERKYGLDGARFRFADLETQEMLRYSDAYFNTFNLLYPLFDEADFTDNSLNEVLYDGFMDGEEKSVLALSVLALGRLAMEVRVMYKNNPIGIS